MGIFDRLARVFKANANAAIDKMEDPSKMLNQTILDMQEQITKAKSQVAGAIADEKRLQKQYEDEMANSKEWEAKAMSAVRAGKDELAAQALARKAEHDKLAQQWKTQWMAQKNAADKLRDQLKVLNNKVEEAKRKKNLLIARQKRAEAQKTIQNTLSGMTDNSAFEAFDRMSEKVDQIEAEAEAATELAGDYTGDDLSKQFEDLDTSAVTQADALAELKRKMGVASDGGSAAPATYQGIPTAKPAEGESWKSGEV